MNEENRESPSVASNLASGEVTLLPSPNQNEPMPLPVPMTLIAEDVSPA